MPAGPWRPAHPRWLPRGRPWWRPRPPSRPVTAGCACPCAGSSSGGGASELNPQNSPSSFRARLPVPRVGLSAGPVTACVGEALFRNPGGLRRLRKHGSNQLCLAGKSSYFCNDSVIWAEPRPRGWDTSGMTDRALRYFDDYLPGASYDCGSVSVSEAEIISFAIQFDPQPFPVDPEAAARGPFGGLIASGWHTAALVMRQLVDHYLSPEASLGSPGLDEMRWPEPVRPGDTLRVRATAVEARRSLSKPDRGILKTLIEAVNQDGRTVMRATATNFLRVRPDPDS